MAQNNISRHAFLCIISVLLLLSAFTALDVWHQNQSLSGEEVAETPVMEPLAVQSGAETAPDDAASHKRHIRLYQGQLAIYAGPVGGEGELLRRLELPLRNLPPRWLAQLTNGGLEFANEETLLMALDNLDELAD